jgi:hypothetical protein
MRGLLKRYKSLYFGSSVAFWHSCASQTLGEPVFVCEMAGLYKRETLLQGKFGVQKLSKDGVRIVGLEI